MARLRGHATLDYTRPLYVKRQSITLAGKTFQQGQELTWRALGVDPRKVHLLWDQRRIGHEKPHERNGAEKIGEGVKPFDPAAAPPIAQPAKGKPANQPRR